MHHAWETASSSSSLDCIEGDTSAEQDRGRTAQSVCLLVFAALAGALALFASHAAGAEHGLFYACYACVCLGFAAYSVLRCSGHLGPGSTVPVAAAFVWILSLLISLGAPSRRRRLLGLEDIRGTEPCEEGSSALWIALLLTSLPVLAPIPAVSFALLGQLMSLQHLVIGLSLPRPECPTDAGGPGGPLLGLPPIWVSTLQLAALAALLACQRHSEKQRVAEKIISDYLADHDNKFNVPKPDLEAKNHVERVVNALEKAEQDYRELLSKLDELLPRYNHGVMIWTLFTRHSTHLLKHCAGQLKKHSPDGDNATDQLFRAMQAGQSNDAAAGAAAVSGWLEHTWSPHDAARHPRARRASIARSEPDHSSECPEEKDIRRLMGRSRSPKASKSEWRIGEWEFNALQCEWEQHNVLQFVGFEFLCSFAILPKTQLVSFLGRLERSYNAGNPYHSHIHGADMTNTFFYLVNRTEIWQLADFSDSTRIAAIVAALGHDVGHFARNSLFLISSRHALAVTYNDRSVLENFHASTLVRLLDEEYGEQPHDRKKLLAGFSAEHLQKARQLMIALILATDPQKHLEELSALRLRLGAASFDPIHDANDQQQCLAMLFRAADIGHSAKEWTLHHRWSLLVVDEFHQQGDEEQKAGLKVSPLCDRANFQLANSQIGFLQFICLPTWKELVNLESRVKSCESIPPQAMAKKSTDFSEPSSGRTLSGLSSRVSSMLSAGSNLQLLPGPEPSGSQILFLPGAPSSNGQAREEPGPPPSRLLSEVCLAHCERNCQLWKKQSREIKTESVVADSTERRNDLLRPELVSRTESEDLKAPSLC